MVKKHYKKYEDLVPGDMIIVNRIESFISDTNNVIAYSDLRIHDMFDRLKDKKNNYGDVLVRLTKIKDLKSRVSKEVITIIESPKLLLNNTSISNAYYVKTNMLVLLGTSSTCLGNTWAWSGDKFEIICEKI